MNNWLVTGGAGFIGSNFVNMFGRCGNVRITVLDSLTYAGNLTSINSLITAGEIEFHRGDICDRELVERLFREKNFDRVIHFAAESHVDRSILGADDFVRSNINGTFTLLEAARGNWRGKSDPLFVHVSTDEVFGDLPLDADPVTEKSPYRPSSPYSASKAASDHLVRAWFRTYGLPIAITNCTNNYGPWQFPEKLIPLMICNGLEGKPLPVYGDGLNIRDWLHVDDHCAAIGAVVTRSRPGETYLIGARNERTNIELVTQICDAIDTVLERVPGSTRKLITYVADRPGHDRRYAISPTKIEAELGWRPTHDFQNSLVELVYWYRRQSDWLQSIRSGAYLNFYREQYGD